MAAFDRDKQKGISLSGSRQEVGTGVTIAGVPTTNNLSKQTFTIATKLRKVRYGFGVMDTDQMPCKATAGLVSSTGQVTFTRYGPVATSADTCTYVLFGD